MTGCDQLVLVTSLEMYVIHIPSKSFEFYVVALMRSLKGKGSKKKKGQMLC